MARVALALLMAVTVYATSMIYASLRTVARWHPPADTGMLFAVWRRVACWQCF